MKTVNMYREKMSQMEREANELAASAVYLNDKLDGYNKVMQDILHRYSFISRKQEKKFSIKKLEKKRSDSFVRPQS